MNLNLLDITIIVILAFYLISGMYRGFITSLLGTVGFVGAWFGTQQLYPRVAKLALSNQTLMAVLNQYLEPESFFESHTQAVSTVSEVIAGGVMSDGSYGIPEGYVYGFPVVCRDGKYEIVQGLDIDDGLRTEMMRSFEEIKEEADTAKELLG